MGMSFMKSPEGYQQYKYNMACDLIRSIHQDDVEAVRILADRGAALDYAFDTPSESQTRVADIAAGKGAIKSLMYLMQRSYVMTSEGVRLATSGGHMHVLKYARACSIPFPKDLFDVVAKTGDLDVANYLLTIRLPPTEDTLAIALRHEHECLVHFLINCVKVPVRPSHRDCVQNAFMMEFLDMAMKNKD